MPNILQQGIYCDCCKKQNDILGADNNFFVLHYKCPFMVKVPIIQSFAPIILHFHKCNFGFKRLHFRDTLRISLVDNV